MSPKSLSKLNWSVCSFGYPAFLIIMDTEGFQEIYYTYILKSLDQERALFSGGELTFFQEDILCLSFKKFGVESCIKYILHI